MPGKCAQLEGWDLRVVYATGPKQIAKWFKGKITSYDSQFEQHSIFFACDGTTRRFVLPCSRVVYLKGKGKPTAAAKPKAKAAAPVQPRPAVPRKQQSSQAAGPSSSEPARPASKATGAATAAGKRAHVCTNKHVPSATAADERYFQQILFGYLDGARRDECSLDDLLAQANAPKAGCRSYMFCQDVVSGWLQKLEEQNFVMVREDKDDGWTVYLI